MTRRDRGRTEFLDFSLGGQGEVPSDTVNRDVKFKGWSERYATGVRKWRKEVAEKIAPRIKKLALSLGASTTEELNEKLKSEIRNGGGVGCLIDGRQYFIYHIIEEKGAVILAHPNFKAFEEKRQLTEGEMRLYNPVPGKKVLKYLITQPCFDFIENLPPLNSAERKKI